MHRSLSILHNRIHFATKTESVVVFGLDLCDHWIFAIHISPLLIHNLGFINLCRRNYCLFTIVRQMDRWGRKERHHLHTILHMCVVAVGWRLKQQEEKRVSLSMKTKVAWQCQAVKLARWKGMVCGLPRSKHHHHWCNVLTHSGFLSDRSLFCSKKEMTQIPHHRFCYFEQNTFFRGDRVLQPLSFFIHFRR